MVCVCISNTHSTTRYSALHYAHYWFTLPVTSEIKRCKLHTSHGQLFRCCQRQFDIILHSYHFDCIVTHMQYQQSFCIHLCVLCHTLYLESCCNLKLLLNILYLQSACIHLSVTIVTHTKFAVNKNSFIYDSIVTHYICNHSELIYPWPLYRTYYICIHYIFIYL